MATANHVMLQQCAVSCWRWVSLTPNDKEIFSYCHHQMKTFILLLTVLSVSAAVVEFPQLRHLKSSTSLSTQAQAAKDLIERVIGDRVSDFDVQVDASIGPKDKDTFQLSTTENGMVEIKGTTGVAAAMGFYHYLKYYCNGQYTWAGQQTQLPAELPAIPTPVKITTNDRFRYYQNVCTVSYSMAFWDWDRWQKEIDWMALHGINLPLAFTGQEAIFQRVYLNMGFTQADLDEHFGGPAFLAWARMGNIEGWGGPLPQMWITNKLVLQHQILDRMRSLGMIPVLSAFAGHVPRAITRVFPQANVTKLTKWGNFNATYTGTYLLDFQDPLFAKIGSAYIEALVDEFGTDHIYNCDTFNEMTPSSSDPAYLASAGKAVFSAMTAADPQAIWLMQGWLFLSSFWQSPQVKALVTSVPQGRMIILDLFSENAPVYSRQQSYYGQPFIWCMLHNFGGTMELFGQVESINKGPFAGRAFPNSTMIGIGLTPEGIHQNEVIYEFMMENAWRTEPRDIDQWIVSFGHQRYGFPSDAVNAGWKLLMNSVYNDTQYHKDHNNVILFRRPSTHHKVAQDRSVYNCTIHHSDGDRVLITERPTPQYNPTSDIWYKPEDLFSAWDQFLAASSELQGSQLFHYDITDLTRNSLQVVALTYYSNMIAAFKKNDTATVMQAGNNLTNLLADMDHLLNANDRFLVGRWIADAKAWGTDSNETKLLQYNARNQITLWGPTGEIRDYASKQWAGVTADYFKPRWEFFTNWLIQLIKNGTSWDGYIFGERVLEAVESPWTFETYSYPTKPEGNPILISRDLHTKYRPVSRDPFFDKLWEASVRKPARRDSHTLFFRRMSFESEILELRLNTYGGD